MQNPIQSVNNLPCAPAAAAPVQEPRVAFE